MSHAKQPTRLRHFIHSFTRLLESRPDEQQILTEGAKLLEDLIAQDDWLDNEFAQPHPERYQQYLLYADGLERFSVVSFVWGPGQSTPIHNHTVWGLIGVLRGQEVAQRYLRDNTGRNVIDGPPQHLQAGRVEAVSPRIGDIHRVSNALSDQTSISIHVYGGNIGAIERSVFQDDGSRKPFVSGYSNTVLPNLWDRSSELNAKLRATA